MTDPRTITAALTGAQKRALLQPDSFQPEPIWLSLETLQLVRLGTAKCTAFGDVTRKILQEKPHG